MKLIISRSLLFFLPSICVSIHPYFHTSLSFLLPLKILGLENFLYYFEVLNYRNPYDESQGLIFLCFICFEVQNCSSCSFGFQTRVLASQQVSDFTIDHPLFCIPSNLCSNNSLELFYLQVVWIIFYSAVHFP